MPAGRAFGRNLYQEDGILSNNYQLIASSTVDLPKAYLDERDIPCALYHFLIDGVQHDDNFGLDLSFDDFYDMIRRGVMPTTSQPNAEEHIALFEPYLKEGRDILYLCFSSGLSGGYNSACVAVEELRARYPERTIHIVDTLGASSGYGLLVDTVADLRDRGASLEEAYAWAEANKLRVHHWFFSTDLQHYKRGGRISASSALIGTILGICPLLNMDNLGRLIPRKKIKGKNNVIREIVKRMEEHADGGLDYAGKCFISNSACYEDARKVADLVEATFKKLDGKVMINSVGTVIGSHTGVGTVALFFFGDERVD